MCGLKMFIKALVLLIVLAYLIFCAVVYFKPQWFFYYPVQNVSDIKTARKNGYPAEEVRYASADGTPLYGWYTKAQPGKPTIVFFHGNSFNIEKFYHKVRPLAQAGYGTFMAEYRGFGGIKGKITNDNLTADAWAAVEYLYSLGIKNSDIVVYGMSLGSHMATHTAWVAAQKEPFAGVILEVPFDTLSNVIKAVFPLPMPLELIVHDRYDNLEKIADIKAPLLVMGGSNDVVVPVFLAQNLYEHAAEPKKMKIYPGGGHIDLDNFYNYRDIIKWLGTNEKKQDKSI